MQNSKRLQLPVLHSDSLCMLLTLQGISTFGHAPVGSMHGSHIGLLLHMPDHDTTDSHQIIPIMLHVIT